MTKVAFAALAPFISGSERSLQLILENASSMDIDPLLITPEGSPLQIWAASQNIKYITIDLRAINKNKPFNFLLNQIKIFRVLRKYRIKVMHSNQIWSFKVFDLATRVLKIKRVCHFRDPITNGSKWWLPNPIDVAIFISKHIEREFNIHFPADHYAHSSTLIDPVKLNPRIEHSELPMVKYRAKESLNIPKEKFIYGFIGQIAPVKGLIELITFLSKLEHDNWMLAVAGKDPSSEQAYLKECKSLIKKLNIQKNVIFLGFLENTATFYLACDVITMFSLEEPLGLIPLEAGASYTPTIANAVGGLPETIQHDKTGWLVDIQDESAVREILDSVMQKDLISVGQAARTYVEKLCQPTAYFNEIKNILS